MTGSKNWSAGDVLNAADVNSILANQVVMVFADSSARDAGFGGSGEPTLAEGMFCYLNDTNEFQIYTGSSWVTIGDPDTLVIYSGKVGIGSGTPAQKFLVYQANGWDSTNYIALIENADTTADQGNVLQLKGGGTTGSTTSKMLDVLDIGGSTEFFVRGDGVTYLRNASKDAGTFDIPHPVKGGDWRLRHSLVEAPRADLIYRGTTTLSGGTATIDLDADSNMTDGTWEVLNRNPWSMVASSGNAVTWSLSGKTLTINSNTADAVCSWIVIGERQDPTIKDSRTRFFDDDGHLIVEAEDANMPGSETFAANETTA